MTRSPHASALKEGRKPIVRFYIPEPYHCEFLPVNDAAFFVKEKPKNRLTDEGIQAVARALYLMTGQLSSLPIT